MNHWQPLWQFMFGYYRQTGRCNPLLWSKEREHDHHIRSGLEETAEKYAARIPGLSPAMWTRRAACGDGWLCWRCRRLADPVTGEGSTTPFVS